MKTIFKNENWKPCLALFFNMKIKINKFIYSFMWNQGLVNLDFDDNKTRFRTNDHISSVIRQDDFQSGNPKTNQVKEKSWRRRPPQREEFFQDQSFLRSPCKVVSALGLSYISFFIYAPKSSKSNIVLNILRIGWFHVFN